LAMSGHAGPIQMDVGVTPVVCRISCGQAAALLKGRRARRTDLTSAAAPSMGTTVKQRAAMNVARPNFVVALANTFATMCLSDFGAMSLTPGPQIGCRSQV
jgi:hypothetical protein